jgi:hypothetical protein
MWHLPLFASWTGPLVTIPSSTPGDGDGCNDAHRPFGTDHAPLITTA